MQVTVKPREDLHPIAMVICGKAIAGFLKVNLENHLSRTFCIQEGVPAKAGQNDKAKSVPSHRRGQV